MSEQQGKYITNRQPAVLIEPSHNVAAINESGLTEYRVWGWVKMSVEFLPHIKRLRGAKLAVLDVIMLTIDESGKSSLTIKQICELTDYSHTEVISSLKELAEGGYLSIDKSGRRNVYESAFAARGSANPIGKETLVKKLESTPVYQSDENRYTGVDSNESSLAIEKSHPSIKSIKRVNNKREDEDAFSVYENNIGLLTPIVSQKIGDMIDEYTDAWVCDAIAESVLRDARNLAYVKAILRNWKEKGRGAKKTGVQFVAPAVDNGDGIYV